MLGGNPDRTDDGIEVVARSLPVAGNVRAFALRLFAALRVAQRPIRAIWRMLGALNTP